MRWHFAYERATWACRGRSPAHPAQWELQDVLALWPVCRGEHCWHLLQKDSTGSSLLLIPTLSSKEVKNLWVRSWMTCGAEQAPSSQEQRGAQCGFATRMCAWITPKWDKTNDAKCMGIEMKATVNHGFPCSRTVPQTSLQWAPQSMKPPASPNIGDFSSPKLFHWHIVSWFGQKVLKL